MTIYDKILTVFAGTALVIAGVANAFASSRCPDQQLPESEPSQGQILLCGGWQVSDVGPYRYRY